MGCVVHALLPHQADEVLLLRELLARHGHVVQALLIVVVNDGRHLTVRVHHLIGRRCCHKSMVRLTTL